MGIVFDAYWIPMALAAVLGAGVGAAAMSGGGRRDRAWSLAGAVLFLAALALAALRWPPGRPGLWLETGLLLVACYTAGFLAGAVPTRGSAAGRPRYPRDAREEG